MDLLFGRYASPFPLLDGMLETGRFLEFVLKFLNLETERTTWEFFLHKVHGKSYEQFRSELQNGHSCSISAEEQASVIRETRQWMQQCSRMEVE